MLFTFLIIISMCFILVKLLPNKPAKQFGKDMQLIEMRREALGYNKPLLEQYVIFLQRSLIGQDWGVSEVLYLGQDVWPTTCPGHRQAAFPGNSPQMTSALL